MYARVIQGQVPADKYDQAVAFGRETGVAAWKSQAGFQGAYLMGDRATGKTLIVSLWDTEPNARAVESGLASVRREATQRYGPLPAAVFEVVGQEGSATRLPEGTFARAAVVQTPSGTLEAGLERGRQGIRVMQQMPGFLGDLMLADRSANQALNISFWQDEVSHRAVDERINAIRREAMEAAGGGTASVDFYVLATYV
jgi:heme-degrading monooxygenase HmoA